MKKLQLKALSLGAREILGREQLKAVMGGSCSTLADCPTDYYCDNGGACVASYPGGSGAGGSASDSTGGGTCGTVEQQQPDGSYQYVQACAKYDATGNFVGCLPC